MNRTVILDDGAGMQLVASDQFGSNVWVEDVKGWLDGAAVRNTWTPRLGDGSFPSTLHREGREMTLIGHHICSSQNEMLTVARALSGAFPSGKEGAGTLRVIDAYGDLTALDLGLDGQVMVEHDMVKHWLRWQIPIRSQHSELYGQPEYATAEVAGSGAGLVWPLFNNAGQTLDWGYSNTSTATVRNTGNSVAYPRVTVTGDMRSGFVVTLSGDHADSGSWRVAWQMDTRPYSPVVVDFAGSVTVNGVDQSWALTEAGWGGVRPGGQVSVNIEPIASGSGSALLELRPTYV